ncbi:MAG: cytochrome b [Gammaproteobacteria bacterium]|nr:cytochrome b [Gammaproteobacteria bacterium]
MLADNVTARFGAVARLLHWLIALLIILQFVLAELAEEAGAARKTDPGAAMEQLMLMARHKSFGITILLLAVVRLAWRLRYAPPPWPPTMPRWQIKAALVTHWAFYALLFLLPISGWLASSAENYPVSWFGLIQLPDFIGPDEAIAHDLEELHETLFGVLVALAALHVIAALKHHFLDHDDVLKRMLPWPTK